MVVKFFSNKGGGGTGAIDYLLDKDRVALGQAKLLKGNEDLTRKLIELIENKQKLTVGCLSFSEENIDEDLKFKLMDEFEKILLAGLDPNQYNILWVEHSDKGRLELNYAIPKQELKNKKALQPYYHKSDLARVEMWQDMTNLRHQFSNPKDPENQRNVNTTKVEIGRTKDYKSLNSVLQKHVLHGKITSRERMIKILGDNNIKVTRVSDDHLSLKLPNSKKARRFKNDIYTSRFTSLESLNVIKEDKENEIEDFKKLDIEREINSLSKRLGRYVERKAKKNKKKYPYNLEAKEELLNIQIHNIGDVDDRIRNKTIRRVREEGAGEQGVYKELGELQRELANNYLKSIKDFRRTRKSMEEEFRTDAENVVSDNDRSTGELRDLFDRIVSKIGELGGKIGDVIEKIKDQVKKEVIKRKFGRR